MSRLVVTGGKFHRYSLDGRRVPGVTSITGKVGSKDGLINAAAKETALWAAIHASELQTSGDLRWIDDAKRAFRRKWDATAEDGRRVHSIAERLVFGEPVEPDDPDTGEPYGDDILRMGQQVADFMDRWQVDPKTALVERPVFHERFRYAGRFDLTAILRGGDRWLIDVKSGASGVWPETAMQLTAYSRCTHVVIGEDDTRMPTIQRCAALWVRPDFWELLPVKSDDETFRAFLHAKEQWDWWQQRPEDVIGAALPTPERSAS